MPLLNASGSGSESGGVTELKNLLDVKIVNPTNYQILEYDEESELWVNSTGVLKNLATGDNGLTIFGVASSATRGINIGAESNTTVTGGVAVGYRANASGQGNFSTALGSFASANRAWALAVGAHSSVYAERAIQIGPGLNREAGTLKIGLPPSYTGTRPETEEEGLYTLLTQDGQIPIGRLSTALSSYVSNTSTIESSLTISGTPSTLSDTFNWGAESEVIGGGAIAIGYQCVSRGTAIGYQTTSMGAYTCAYGSRARASSSYSASMGYRAVANATRAFQLGQGTNSNIGTLQFRDWTVVDDAGNIPEERLANTIGNINAVLDAINGEVI